MRKSIIILGVLLGSISQANDAIELDINNLVRAAEIKYAIPEGLLAAIIKVESSGNHRAKNKDDGTSQQKQKGLVIPSYGLMQMQLASARFIQLLKAKQNGLKLRKKDLVSFHQLMIPETNIEYGAAYVKWLLNNSKGDVALALTGFNVGPHSGLYNKKRYYGMYVGKVLNAWLKNKSNEE